MRISDWSSDVCSSDLGSWGSAAEHDAIVGAEADEPVDCRWILHRITARRFLQGHAAQELAHRHFHFLAGQRVGNVGEAVELIRPMPRTALDAQLALELLAQRLLGNKPIAHIEEQRQEETPAGTPAATT